MNQEAAAMRRIVLGLQYDGSSWQGYQSQPHQNTVQDVLEAALAQFSTRQLHTTCAGRTDAGVHALQQVVHFDTDLARSDYSWVNGVNAFLPKSIAVRWACEVPLALADGREFHARFAATSRTYHYLLFNNKVRSPILAGRAGWVFRPLDLQRMQEAAACLLGTHDFSAFRAAGCQAKTPVKEMHEVRIRQIGDMFVFTLRASAFLHHMVRNIVGSLIYVGSGAKPAPWLGEVLAAGDRSRAAPTFMPDGLYLAQINYDPAWGLPMEDYAELPFLHGVAG
ncbi:tRNA pseudouridine(38-40) synthase TruA [Massilia sp. W12]|uniref:tRNA pseudouridine(38-40) synthase TruA n=1 Tax=Massilia sp. W12 TaxID=3126507 RepID=UPI0030D2D6C0